MRLGAPIRCPPWAPPKWLRSNSLDRAFEGSDVRWRASGPPGFSIFGSGVYGTEGYRRTRAAPEIAGPSTRGRAPHPIPRLAMCWIRAETTRCR